MDTYRELYYHLFHVNETALRALERSDVSGAVRILSAGQREAERPSCPTRSSPSSFPATVPMRKGIAPAGRGML